MDLPFGSLLLWCAWLLRIGGFSDRGTRAQVLAVGLGAVLVLHLWAERAPQLIGPGLWLLAAVAVLPTLGQAAAPLGLSALAGATGTGLFALQFARATGLDLALAAGLVTAAVARAFGHARATAATAALATLLATAPEVLTRLGQPLLAPSPESRYQCLAAAVAAGLLLERLRLRQFRSGRRPLRV